MTGPAIPESEPLSQARTIRFTPSQWERIEAAAAAFSEHTGMRIDAVEVVRSGASRRAEEILEAHTQRQQPAA